MSAAMPTADYVVLARSLERAIPKARIATDRLRTLLTALTPASID